ncbi:hypothetical protein IFM89_022975 [Coptis chinensis]|uniref:Uncharacterized protein n=1 Tax=Coptis chinensis TaxID=261450 RepID=A0A835M685_9MAGN|nr:hypothetical protein IFM89_022975 [Coptis chinensis]
MDHQPPQEEEEELQHHHHHYQNQDEDDPSYSLPSISEIIVFHDEEEDEEEDNNNNNNNNKDSSSPSSSDADDTHHVITTSTISNSTHTQQQQQTHFYISPEPHVSTQFYTFNQQSHSLMVQCILDQRLATPDEIRTATARPVLKSWRSVWKDRNEDTAYITAWKRIQDKLNAHIDTHGNQVLYFKSNCQQYVSHIEQWQDIVMSFHGDADLKHLGVKETIERIKQVWTVGAKLYGIPESFIRACVRSCPVCCDGSSSSRPKRQKYIRYKPFMAEVKDYACHRAGEPGKIRAIVPIANYNEKDKSFVYQEEGVAVFKLYAVHTGHERVHWMGMRG